MVANAIRKCGRGADNDLAKKGDDIWEKIEGYCKGKESDEKRPAVVTTFTREDVRFKKFVESHLGSEKSCIHFDFIAKRDSLENQKSYFLLPWAADEFKNRPVISDLCPSSFASGRKRTRRTSGGKAILHELLDQHALLSGNASYLVKRCNPRLNSWKVCPPFRRRSDKRNATLPPQLRTD